MGLEEFRGQSPLGFEALLLCSFLQLITGLIGGVVTHQRLGTGRPASWGAGLLLFSMLLSLATYSFFIGGILNGIASALAFSVRSKPQK